MRKLVFVLLVMTAALVTHSQKHPKHSLAIGLKTGAASVTFRELNTAHVGLAMDHQRNFGQVFSLRTGLHVSYFLPVKTMEKLPWVPNSERWKTYEIDEFSAFQGSLRLMPCIYHRDENFNLFLGLAGGLGLYSSYSRGYDEHYTLATDSYDLSNTYYRQETDFQIGFSPVFGAGFNLGSKREGGEIEISLSYENWYANVRDWEFSNSVGGFTGFSIQTSYRYNFKY